MRRRTLLIGGAVAGALLPTGLAHAHSELRHTTPADGARLTSAPDSLSFSFNERVQLTAVRLFAADGSELPVLMNRALISRPDHMVRLPTLQPGDFRVEWRAISADGHPIGGTIRFAVLAG